jgi:L-threonylcarbamoyladenylate synthase
MIGTDLAKAKEILDRGEPVAIPTETVYGLAANATESEAVLKIFAAKNRPFFDPLISHFPSIEMVKEWVPNMPEKALKLAEAFWPGSLTIILPKSDRLPDVVTAGLNTMGVRIPNHPMALKLLESLDYPLAAPSANPFGYVSPTQAQHVEEQLGDKVPYILDGGPCEVGLESTIISFVNPSQPHVLRYGGIPKDKLEKIIGPVGLDLNKSSNPEAPGQLKKHYSPNTKFILTDNLQDAIQQLDLSGQKVAVLRYQKSNQFKDHFHLSENGTLPEAAQNLFASLRKLDALNLDLIIAEKVPHEGLGMAINDRLERAANQ